MKRSRGIVAAITAIAVAMLALAGLALASSKTLNTANNTTLNEKIAVDSQGRTVYALKGETTKKLLCTSKSCLKLWPMATVKKGTKLTKAAGIKGKLTTVKRGSVYQLVLGGDPLYYYSQDKSKGDVKGNGIKSFGGTWHVIQANGVIYGGY
jgi:predicted lipoprotein with Yx(FWY)xxD motif